MLDRYILGIVIFMTSVTSAMELLDYTDEVRAGRKKESKVRLTLLVMNLVVIVSYLLFRGDL